MSPRTPLQIKRMLEPSESQSQQAIFRYFLGDLRGDREPGIGLTGKYPQLIDLYAIPNQGARSAANGARMKAEGMHKSMCDMCLPSPAGPFHGLYLEGKNSWQKVRPDQGATIDRLRARGYCAMVWRSAEEGIRAILWYVELGFYVDGSPDQREELMDKCFARMQDRSR